MTITLTPEHERIIQAQLATGQFRSVEDVLEKVLAPLKSQAAEEATMDGGAKARAAAERIRQLRKGVTLDRPAGMSLRTRDLQASLPPARTLLRLSYIGVCSEYVNGSNCFGFVFSSRPLPLELASFRKN